MSAEVHELYQHGPDLDVAIDFLQAINPDGRQMLVSIRDGEIIERTFSGGCWEDKRALMAAWAAESRNVYALVNEPLASSREKSGIAFIRAVFSDTDSKAVKDRALAAGDDLFRSSRPAFVTDSGGGVHTFWVLDKPVAVTETTMKQAEDAGRGLREFFDGDAVQDISRIMRVPGTVNYLDAKKRARGRQIAPTAVLMKSEARVTLEGLLEDYPAPAGGGGGVSDEAIKAAMAEIDMGQTGKTYNGLPNGLRVRFEASRAWKSGLWGSGLGTGDHSQNVYRLALILNEEGFTATEFAMLADCWVHAKPCNVEWRQLGRAWAKTTPGAQAAKAFNDGAPEPVEGEEGPAPSKAAPRKGLVFIDPARAPATLARREWLYGRRLIRGYLSSTIAAGGTGKSSLEMAEAVAMTTGIDILKEGVDRMAAEPLRVWIWNGEDPQMELDLRFFAIMKHYGIAPGAFGVDRMAVMSGRDSSIAVAGQARRGFGVDRECVAWIREIITVNRIDVVMIDPFVSSHRVPENDNMAIDLVAKVWSRIAEECGCAVSLSHHIRKPGNGVVGDLTVDDARGASALINASRNARVLSPMGKEAADGWGIPNRKAYFSIQHDATKANMIPAGVGADWYHFISVDVGNGDVFALPKIDGDQVGVVEKWTPPAAMSMDDPAVVNKTLDEIAKGRFRADEQSPAWVGHVLKEGSKKKKRDIINDWIEKGWLKKEVQKDETRHEREFVVVGNRPEEELF